jgi:hypothetical protein
MPFISLLSYFEPVSTSTKTVAENEAGFGASKIVKPLGRMCF